MPAVEGARTPRPEPPAWLKPIDNPGEGDLIRRLVDLGVVYSVVKVVLGLGPMCERYSRPGVWSHYKTLAKACRVKPSTFRVAFGMLVDLGWAAKTRELVETDGVLGYRDVYWCAWMMPSGSVDGESFDLGGGVPSRPAGAADCAQPTARKNRKWTASKDRSSSPRTRDDDDFSAPPPGDGEQRPVPIPAAEPMPLDPVIAAAIGDQAGAAGPAELAELVAEVPAWQSAEYPVERIARAIRRAFDQRRRGKVITDPVAYVAKILANDRRSSRASPGRADEPRREPEAAAVIAPIRSTRMTDAERRRRWEALTEARRLAIAAEVERDSPVVSATVPRFRPSAILMVCLERMDLEGDP